MSKFKVGVYDRDALLPGGRAKGHYVTQLETDTLSEAALFMEAQTQSSSLHIDGRVVYLLHPKDATDD